MSNTAVQIKGLYENDGGALLKQPSQFNAAIIAIIANVITHVNINVIIVIMTSASGSVRSFLLFNSTLSLNAKCLLMVGTVEFFSIML